MPSQIVHDSDYRRGVILGLTMAEVLMLLLFMLLLALGSQINNKQNEVVMLRETIDKLDGGKERLANTQLSGEVSRLNVELEQYQQAFPDKARLGSLKKSVEKAAEINPADPASALAAAINLMAELDKIPGLPKGTAADPGKLASEIAKLDEENKALKSRLEAAEAQLPGADKLQALAERDAALREIDPNAPPQDLERALDFYLGVKRGLEGTNLAASAPSRIANLAKQAEREKNAAGAGKNPWPPMIQLSEAGGFFFEKGSAALKQDFREKLNGEISTRLLDFLDQYDVDVIEIIGHTDEQPIAPRTSNLDLEMLNALEGKTSEAALRPADNAGLGMARALAVLKVLRADPRMAEWKIIPLSGAQLIDKNGAMTTGKGGDIKERRRIEIRLRGTGETEKLVGQ